jgi:hypothetical protein
LEKAANGRFFHAHAFHASATFVLVRGDRNAFTTNGDAACTTVAFNFAYLAKGESVREVLDCGVLLAPGHEGAMRDWVARHQARLTRIRLHLVPLVRTHAAEANAELLAAPAHGTGVHPHPLQDVQVLARLAISLKRYDGCILPVTPSTVAWARMALAQAGTALTTPILLLMDDMKAPAIEDLLGLGVADFIAQPACLESMRVRLDRMARPAVWRQPSRASVREPAASYPGGSEAAAHEAARPRLPAELVEQAAAGMREARRLPAQESFRLAKSRVVDGFERDYIRHALSRHGGNVAQAARACDKHRRAFWALMRKHGIEAAPYRQAALARRAEY